MRGSLDWVRRREGVFDAATSFAGEWGVDETIDSLPARDVAGSIVVAVDNGGAHRMEECGGAIGWR